MMCDCSMESANDHAPSFADMEWRRARIEHVCCECGDQIRPGKRYERVAGVWDGEWSSFKTCAPCVAIRKHYCPDGWYYGGLAEALECCLGFDYREVPE